MAGGKPQGLPASLAGRLQAPLQLLFDFFEDAPAPAGKTPRRRAKPPVPPGTPAAPPATLLPPEPGPPQARWAERNIPPGPPAEPLAQVLQPQVFRHPDANREILLGDLLVAYEFTRAKRRNIGFLVSPEGLVVRAPKWVPLAEVDAAIRTKAGWIRSKLDQARERQQRIAAARIAWRDGALFPYLGGQVAVLLDPRSEYSGRGAMLRPACDPPPEGPQQVLHVGLPHTASASQVRDAVQAWLMREAKQLFTQRLDHFAPQLGVQWRKLALSSAGTLWGTAHADGSIRLNWRLIHFRLPVIDYVVAHELSHLRVMDHSPRFWDTVRTVVPDYQDLRRQLKDSALPPWGAGDAA